ncbi:MAG: Crp/Fnr family transcriptional regulator [Ruminococcaceae bacterium]|nr:Crp/Fnr family transcriptional regulator [Oscillospiraceae bacterium]
MDYLFLSKTVLFHGITPEELKEMLLCLRAETKSYRRGEVIFRAGDTVSDLGLVLSGSVSVENDDVWGNKSILDRVQPGQAFAETYACVPGAPLMISAVATEPAEILFLDMSRVLYPCSNACGFHNKLVRNLLAIASQKNLNLSRRIFHTSSKSIRGRLLSYLSFQSMQQGSREFVIPFNRQQLADYLSVDRSALSNELSKMQRDGLIRVERSHFRLLSVDPTDAF